MNQMFFVVLNKMKACFEIELNFRKWNEGKKYEKLLSMCAVLSTRAANETMGLSVISFGLNMELKLLRIHAFYNLIFKSVETKEWQKLKHYMAQPEPDLNDAIIASELEAFLLKESEFMLMLPIIQAVYDSVLLVFKLICDGKHAYLLNLEKVLTLVKKLLLLQTLWISQSGIRVKHQPVFEKYVQSIDLKRFFALSCEALVTAEKERKRKETHAHVNEEWTEVMKKVANLLRLFRHVNFESSNCACGVFALYGRNSKQLVFTCDDINEPVRHFPNPPNSIVDDVRFLRLGVRPITDLKQCSRCGKRQGLRAKKQFRWPLWEAIWSERSVCELLIN